MEEPLHPRLLLLLPTHTYRADEFVDAAKRLGFDLTVASEVPSALEAQHPAELLTLDFADPESAVAGCKAFAAQHPIAAVIGPDDATAVLAAMMSRELGCHANPVAAVLAARNKIIQRELLRDSGIPVPDFRVLELSEDPADVASSVSFPCVVKPTSLSASRGVIRANDPEEFVAAHARLRSILESAAGGDRYIVEQYIPGVEFAVEGLIVDGGLHVLAIFDKPDPLEGPFFEETIYVTPSRAKPGVQNSLIDTAGRAAGALGLTTGPLHAELRCNKDGPWVIELAARLIGGKCGRVLRFGETGERSLEDVVVAHAAGTLNDIPCRESCAAGVMMIPIPSAGVLAGCGKSRVMDDSIASRKFLS